MRVAFGCGCFAFAAVSSAVDVGPRSVLVLVLRVCCWFYSFAFGVGFGPSRLVLGCVFPFAFGVGFGRSSCAMVSFRLFPGSAPRVGWPSRNLAKMCAVRVVRLPCLNSDPRIPAVKSGRPPIRPVR